MKKTELIAALDLDSLDKAVEFVDSVGPSLEWVKIGSHLFSSSGPDAVREMKKRNKKVFLDLKYHDIPNTVARAVAASVAHGVDMLNVHASGGREMMSEAIRAARNAAHGNRSETPIVIAVTVLTSMNDSSLMETIGFGNTPLEADKCVAHFAKLAKDSGLSGVVCSAREIGIVRSVCGNDFILVVPGIRPAGAKLDDQKRVMTPGEAAELGADFIVVGRPLLEAKDPAAAAGRILADIRK